MSTPRFKGASVDLGGTAFIVPALALGSLETFQDRLTSFTGGTDKESIAFVLDITTAALKRNYPEISRAELAELIDLSNMQEVLDAVLGASGLKDAAGAASPPATA